MQTEKNKALTINDVINNLKQIRKNVNTKLILKAYNFAKENHVNQKRLSGEDYIIHPLNVANILSEIQLDDETICAAIMHDLVEDTKVTKEDIEKEFGMEIAEMVDRCYETWKASIYNKRRRTS